MGIFCQGCYRGHNLAIAAEIDVFPEGDGGRVSDRNIASDYCSGVDGGVLIDGDLVGPRDVGLFGDSVAGSGLNPVHHEGSERAGGGKSCRSSGL